MSQKSIHSAKNDKQKNTKCIFFGFFADGKKVNQGMVIIWFRVWHNAAENKLMKNDKRQKKTKCSFLHNLLCFTNVAWHRETMFMFDQFNKKDKCQCRVPKLITDMHQMVCPRTFHQIVWFCVWHCEHLIRHANCFILFFFVNYCILLICCCFRTCIQQKVPSHQTPFLLERCQCCVIDDVFFNLFLFVSKDDTCHFVLSGTIVFYVRHAYDCTTGTLRIRCATTTLSRKHVYVRMPTRTYLYVAVRTGSRMYGYVRLRTAPAVLLEWTEVLKPQNWLKISCFYVQGMIHTAYLSKNLFKISSTYIPTHAKAKLAMKEENYT